MAWNPNQPNPQNQPNPVSSAQGNTPSNGGQGTVQPPATPAGDVPAGTPAPNITGGVQTQPATVPATGSVTPELQPLVASAESATGIRFADLPPDAQRLLNSIAAAARRDGEASGRTASQREAEQAAAREAATRQEREGEPDQRVAAAITRADNAERERDEARAELLRLRVALRVGAELNVPNAFTYADRLRGTTEQDIEADARSFLATVGGVVPRPATPPATPAGGNDAPTGGNPAAAQTPPNSPQPPRDLNEATNAQRNSGAYSII